MYRTGSASAIGWLARTAKRLAHDRAGNVLPLVAAAIIPMLALTGGGIDMGRSYLSQSRLQQACDAGVLAARKKLPAGAVGPTVPTDAATIGNRFFNINFRAGSYGTNSRSFAMKLEANQAVSGTATVNVPTTIMKLFGQSNMPVSVKCEAQLSFSNIDIMMVLDVTGSMNDKADVFDSQTKMQSLKSVVKSFYTQMETQRNPTSRVRYGFVPYSTNVNVGGLLANNWVVDDWTYQSRRIPGGGSAGLSYNWINWTYISGANPTTVVSTYRATYHFPLLTEIWTWPGYYTCDKAAPADTYTASYVELSRKTEFYPGPPVGTKTTIHYRITENGIKYAVVLSGTTCEVRATTHTDYVSEFDYVTFPSPTYAGEYEYMPVQYDVRNWRADTKGCVEERATYEIDNYANVDLNRALDLNLDLVPTADPATRWRPQYPDFIYERSVTSYNDTRSQFTVNPVTSTTTFFKPTSLTGLVTCPTPSRKLAPMTATELNAYVDSLTPEGATYHDIGMIWGGRLISPTGLFASENADIGGVPTSRNLIFLTDGETAPMDIVYGAYGVEPLDRRRWTLESTRTLTDVVEKRFAFACDEVKRRNVTVWVISFGLTISPLMQTCAGPGHYFQADNAVQLNNAFVAIGRSIGDLRISK